MGRGISAISLGCMVVTLPFGEAPTSAESVGPQSAPETLQTPTGSSRVSAKRHCGEP